MFEASPGKGGAVLRSVGAGAPPAGQVRRGATDPGFTDEQGELVTSDDGRQNSVDPVARTRARQIAARLAIPRPRRDTTAHRGAGDLASLPYRGGSDDIDLDGTLEVLAERPVPEDEDIIVRERVRTRRAVMLVIDVSGSMKGERIRTAAAMVGALAAELVDDALGVIAFWSDAAILLHLGQPVEPMRLVDDLLRLPARGLTNISFPLEVAARELGSTPARDLRVLLLSDCLHNAGPDPRLIAARLHRLDVLLDTSGESDVELGRDLARIGRGVLRPIRTYRDVAPALSRIFQSR